jgi:hypothetical protein
VWMRFYKESNRVVSVPVYKLLQTPTDRVRDAYVYAWHVSRYGCNDIAAVRNKILLL